jgi:hypothetical protein
MNIFTFRIICIATMFLFFGCTISPAPTCYAGEDLQSGSRYRILKPMYLMGVYNSLNNRQVNKAAAKAFLDTREFANTSWVAFQCKVPKGTIMTVISPAPKRKHFPLFPKRYFVQLEPDLSQGLDIYLELKRRIGGSLDGLNPEFFSRLEESLAE